MKYKVGDKVRVIKINYEDDLKTKGLIGQVYEISTICKNDRGYGLYGSVCVWQENELELTTEEPSLFDRIKSAIIEAGKQAPIIIEQTEDGGVKISPIVEEDLPINTLVMVCSDVNRKIDVTYFNLRRYAGKGYIYALGESASNCIDTPIKIDIIIPFDKFNPNNIEESLKYNIVK